MRLLIVAVGQRVPDWAQSAWADYAKRFPPELKVELKAVKTEPRGSRSLETLLAAERSRIEAALPRGCRVVALDERGTALTTVALADKLDTLTGFFAIDEKPTGSKDPYALRRAALGVIRIVMDGQRRLSLTRVLQAAGDQAESLLPFFADRLKVALREQGKRFDLVDAVFSLKDDDLVRIVARVDALDTFLKTEDGANLLAGYRRAVNILKAEEKKGPLPTGTPTAVSEPSEEAALFAALQAMAPKLDAALAAEDFTGAMSALAGLRAPVDAFFTAVLVNSTVASERENRLMLLQQVRDGMGKVADFGLVTG